MQTKKDIPELNLLAGESFSTGMEHIMFGFNPGSPFRDERVRQAFSMLVDRDLWMDTFLNLGQFRTDGVEVPNRWHSHMPSGWDGFWLDPQTNALGANAKYFKYNVAEAKSLLAAAGYKDGFDTVGSFFTTAQYGSSFPQRNEVIFDMVAEGGIRVRRNVIDFTIDYNDKYHRAKGKFDGVSSSAGGARVDPGLWMHTHYHNSGSAVHIDPGADPEIDRLIELQFREFDNNKRIQILGDLQKHLAKTMSLMPMAGVSASLSLSWPWVGNQGVYFTWPGSTYGGPTETGIHTWIDNSKKS
jgi:ABC-type transport system substrate-binding protein